MEKYVIEHQEVVNGLLTKVVLSGDGVRKGYIKLFEQQKELEAVNLGAAVLDGFKIKEIVVAEDLQFSDMLGNGHWVELTPVARAVDTDCVKEYSRHGLLNRPSMWSRVKRFAKDAVLGRNIIQLDELVDNIRYMANEFKFILK